LILNEYLKARDKATDVMKDLLEKLDGLLQKNPNPDSEALIHRIK
jgi:hypothetical protein